MIPGGRCKLFLGRQDKNGFIFKPANVVLRGPHAILDSSVDSQFDDNRNRPALAQTFSQRSNDARLTVVVNHLKSKGSSCVKDGDPNRRDGQGNCNQTRRNAAIAIADWLQTDPTAVSIVERQRGGGICLAM